MYVRQTWIIMFMVAWLTLRCSVVPCGNSRVLSETKISQVSQVVVWPENEHNVYRRHLWTGDGTMMLPDTPIGLRPNNDFGLEAPCKHRQRLMLPSQWDNANFDPRLYNLHWMSSIQMVSGTSSRLVSSWMFWQRWSSWFLNNRPVSRDLCGLWVEQMKPED